MKTTKPTKFNILFNESFADKTKKADRILVEEKIEDNREKASVLFDQLSLLKNEARDLTKEVDRLSVQTEAYVVQFMRLSFEIQRTMEQVKELVVYNELAK